MFLRIDPADGLPIYDQIVRQIKFAVARKALVLGDRVPSVRELARDLAINPNTVARAYQQLQAEGILSNVRGLGLEVAAGALETCRQDRRKLIQARVRQTLTEAQQSGLEDDELRKLLDRELSIAQRKGKANVGSDSA
jgi:GntR family transcriptional regulator